jgi:hypothetical protein
MTTLKRRRWCRVAIGSFVPGLASCCLLGDGSAAAPGAGTRYTRDGH